jgi:hypothetical protein
MSFNKFPLQKFVWYVAALRRNPEFIQECDEAVTRFLEGRPDILETEKSNPDRPGDDPCKSPWVLRGFMDSPQGEALGRRWGLIESWHYSCPDFPIPERYCPIKPISSSQGSLHLEVDLTRPKGDLIKWFEFQIDRFKPRQSRGKDIDPEFPFEVWDLHQNKGNFWHITCELFPEVAGQDHNIDPEAKSRYEQVRRAYKKAKKWIDSITPA